MYWDIVKNYVTGCFPPEPDPVDPYIGDGYRIP